MAFTAPLMAISLAAPDTLMADHCLLEPNVRPAPSAGPLQVAVSLELGGMNGANQLAPAVRSVPVGALVTVAAKADGALTANKLKHTTNLAIVALQLIYEFQARRSTIVLLNFGYKTSVSNGLRPFLGQSTSSIPFACRDTQRSHLKVISITIGKNAKVLKLNSWISAWPETQRSASVGPKRIEPGPMSWRPLPRAPSPNCARLNKGPHLFVFYF